jgi:tRNA isopentenyl-2-thiomethyl-A-37 hydroxylase MiaE
MEIPLVNKTYLLKKYPGKGGWTYTEIPEIPQDRHRYFGWVQVRGTIDSFEIKQYKLMPMGNGNLFLPVKKEIRKKIGKEAGDTIHVILYADNSPLEIPDELLVCLLDSPKAHQFFMSLTESSQKHYIDWIYEAKQLETKVNRIAKTIERLEKGLKMYDKEENE